MSSIYVLSNTRISNIPQFCYSNRLDTRTSIQLLQQFSEKLIIHEWEKWGNPNEAFCPFGLLRGYIKDNPEAFTQEAFKYRYDEYTDLSRIWLKEHYPELYSSYTSCLDVRWMPTYSVKSSLVADNALAMMIFEEDLRTEWRLVPVLTISDPWRNSIKIWDENYSKWLSFNIPSRIDGTHWSSNVVTHLAFRKLLESWQDWKIEYLK